MPRIVNKAALVLIFCYASCMLYTALQMFVPFRLPTIDDRIIGPVIKLLFPVGCILFALTVHKRFENTSKKAIISAVICAGIAFALILYGCITIANAFYDFFESAQSGNLLGITTGFYVTRKATAIIDLGALLSAASIFISSWSVKKTKLLILVAATFLFLRNFFVEAISLGQIGIFLGAFFAIAFHICLAVFAAKLMLKES